MPHRTIVTKELAGLLTALAHPHRLRIVEEIGHGEKDVTTLQGILGTSQSTVSQHLAVLRTHGVCGERRQGRHVYYRLLKPSVAEWLLEGLQFIVPARTTDTVELAVERARRDWSGRETSLAAE